MPVTHVSINEIRAQENSRHRFKIRSPTRRIKQPNVILDPILETKYRGKPIEKYWIRGRLYITS